MQTEQLPDRAQDQPTNVNPRCHSHEQNGKGCDDEEPIRYARAPRLLRVREKLLVIPFVRFEPKRKYVAHARNDSDDFVDQDVERHSRQQNFRQTPASRLNQDQRRNNCGSGIANSRDQTDQRIKSKLKL